MADIEKTDKYTSETGLPLEEMLPRHTQPAVLYTVSYTQQSADYYKDQPFTRPKYALPYFINIKF